MDNSDFKQKLDDSSRLIRKSGADVRKEGMRIDDMIKKIGTSVGIAFGGAQILNFAKQCAMVRGEFQQLAVAYTTMLGSKERADALMAQTVEFAAKTPFDLKGVAAGAKQLLAYGSAAEEVVDELRMLGDIAAGLSIPLGDIVYLYGTTRTQGRMYTMDLRQFMGRGIPLAEELAKQFGVAKNEVNGLVTAGKVGFEDMKKALVSMTTDGGKFANLMDEQSKTITGKISNLGDAVQTMFNNIGKSNEGVINSAIDGASYLVENYEKVGKVIISLVASYGAYKAVLIAVAAAQKIRDVKILVQLFMEEARAIGLATTAQKSFNIAANKNIYAVVASLVIAAITAIVQFTGKTKSATEAIEELNRNVRDEMSDLDDLKKRITAVNSRQEDRTRAINELNSRYGDYLSNMLTEKSTVDDLTVAYEEAKKAIIGKNLAQAKDVYLSDETKNFTKVNKKFWKQFDRLTEGMSAAKKGRMTREVQDWLNQYSQFNSPGEIYRKIKDIYSRYTNGAQITNSGKLFGAVGDYKKASDNLRYAEKQYKEYARGYSESNMINSAIVTAKSGNSNEGDDKKKGAKPIVNILNSVADLNAKISALKALQEQSIDNTIWRQYQKQIDALQLRIDGITGSLDDELLTSSTAADMEKADYYRGRLEEYKTFSQQRADIEKKYDEDILLFRSNSNKEAEQEALRQKEEALFDFDMQHADELKEAFSDVGRMTKGEMVRAMEILRQKIKQTTDPQQLKVLNEQFIELRENVEKIDFGDDWLSTTDWTSALKSFLVGRQSFESAKQKYLDVVGNPYSTDDEVDNAAAKMEEARTNMYKGIAGAGINSFVNGLQTAADLMRQIADASGDIQLAETAEMLSSISQYFGAAAQGAASGGWIGTIVGGVTDMINQTIEAFSTAKMELLELENCAEDFRRKMMINALEVDDMDTMFGTKSLAKAKDGYSKAQQAMSQYLDFVNREYEGITAKEKAGYSWGSLIFGGLPLGAPAWTALTIKKSNEYLQQLDALQKGYNALQAMSVKTTDYNGWANFWGKQDKFTSLKDLAPELWDEDGTFNVANAKAFLETNTQITEEQRKQIQQAIDLKDAYDDAMQVVEDTVESFIGNMATDMADAIWDSVVNGGGDAWDKWQDIGAEAIANIGKQMIAEMLITAYFEKYKDALIDAFSGKGDKSPEEVIAEIVGGMQGVYDNAMYAANEFAKQAEANGFNLKTGGEVSTGTGFQTMSQETGTELNGRFSDLQVKAAEGNAIALRSRDMLEEIRGFALLQAEYLYDIRKNTSVLTDTNQKLDRIIVNTSKL